MKSGSCRVIWIVIGCVLGGSAGAAAPRLELGPKPSFGLFQPRVSVELFADADGTQSLGPATANSFLLDTGANSTLAFAQAAEELQEAGYQVEGTFEESGISGVETFDVSAPYRLEYQGTDGQVHALSDVRLLSTTTGAVDPTGLMNLHGIVGMQAMQGRVTTLDNRSRQGALPLSMGLKFGDELPASSTHRFTAPLRELVFPVEGDGPFPSAASLSTLEVASRHGDQARSDQLVLDSGAQLTIISKDIAAGLGLDQNGDGDFADEATVFVPIGGVGGTVQAPVLTVDELRVPTQQGFDLVWTNAEVIVQDIHPLVPGVIAADLMSGDGGLDLSLLGGLGGGGLGGLEDLLGGGDLLDLLGGDLGDLLGGGGGLGDLLGGGGFGDLLGGGGGLGDLLGGDLGGLLGGDLLGGGGGLDDLLGGLLGGGGGLGDLTGLLGGGGDLFASFPLESYFDQVHFDFRDFPTSPGTLVYDVNPQISARILNGDGVFDVHDIDDLTAAIGSDNAAFDVDGDGGVALADREMLVTEVFQTLPGDANLDGEVNFADFLVLSNEFGNTGGWGEGEFDGDQQIGFSDFLLLAANFNGGGQAVTAPVPEPATGGLAAWIVMAGWLRGRRRASRVPRIENLRSDS